MKSKEVGRPTLSMSSAIYGLGAWAALKRESKLSSTAFFYFLIAKAAPPAISCFWHQVSPWWTIPQTVSQSKPHLPAVAFVRDVVIATRNITKRWLSSHSSGLRVDLPSRKPGSYSLLFVSAGDMSFCMHRTQATTIKWQSAWLWAPELQDCSVSPT